MSKYKLPLKLAKELNYKKNPSLKYVVINTDIYSSEKDNTILVLNDKNADSDFYFALEKTESANKYKAEYKPASSNTIARMTTESDLDQTIKLMISWLNVVVEFHQIEIFSTDSIVQGFADDYYTEINLIDEDADVKPFSTNQILALDEYLELVENKIDDFKDGTNDAIIDDIKADSKELRLELTKQPKNYILKKLTIIWGKISKQGVPLIKEFIKEGIKEVVKIGVKTMIEGT